MLALTNHLENNDDIDFLKNKNGSNFSYKVWINISLFQKIIKIIN